MVASQKAAIIAQSDSFSADLRDHGVLKVLFVLYLARCTIKREVLVIKGDPCVIGAGKGRAKKVVLPIRRVRVVFRPQE